MQEPQMSRLPDEQTKPHFNESDLTEADRRTYRIWAIGTWVVYLAIAAIVILSKLVSGAMDSISIQAIHSLE